MTTMLILLRTTATARSDFSVTTVIILLRIEATPATARSDAPVTTVLILLRMKTNKLLLGVMLL